MSLKVLPGGVGSLHSLFKNQPLRCPVGGAQSKVPFKSVGDWPEHIQKLTHFWWVRFGGKPYLFNYYNPVPKHFFAGFNRDLLTRWLFIFQETLQSHLTSEQAALWRLVSERMGEGLSMKNEIFRREYESREQELRGDRESS